MAALLYSEYPIPIQPFRVLYDRIQASLASGKLLYGCFYDRELKLDSLGHDRLPMIQPLGIEYDELIFGGQSPTPGQVGNTPVVVDGRISYFVAAKRDYAFCRLDSTERLGVFEWVSRFCDVLEGVYEAGGRDSLLCGTCRKPIKISVKENYVSELSQAVRVEVEYYTVPFTRAGRCN